MGVEYHELFIGNRPIGLQDPGYELCMVAMCTSMAQMRYVDSQPMPVHYFILSLSTEARLLRSAKAELEKMAGHWSLSNHNADSKHVLSISISKAVQQRVPCMSYITIQLLSCHGE